MYSKIQEVNQITLTQDKFCNFLPSESLYVMWQVGLICRDMYVLYTYSFINGIHIIILHFDLHHCHNVFFLI